MIEIVLQCCIVEHCQKKWNELLSEIEFFLNIVIFNATEHTSFKLLYDCLSENEINSADLNNLSSVNKFINARQEIRHDASDTIHLTEARMIIYYDQQHQSIELHDQAYLHVVCHRHHNYSLLENNIIASIHIESFKIIEQVELLAYCLHLLSQYTDIHLIISIAHLEHYSDSDSYNCQLSFSSLTLVNSIEQNEAEKIIDNKIRNNIHMMKMRWTNNTEIWKSCDNLLQDSLFLIHHYEVHQCEQCQQCHLECDQNQ